MPEFREVEPAGRPLATARSLSTDFGTTGTMPDTITAPVPTQPVPTAALPLRRPIYPARASDYATAARDFCVLRDLCTRKTHENREFALVDTLTNCLREEPRNGSKSLLQRLLVDSKLSYHTMPPDLSLKQLEKYIRVFYILVDLGCPNLIHLFGERGLDDRRLPMKLATIQEIEVDAALVEADFHDQFFKRQYFWCPMTFAFDEGQIRGNQIVPIYSREEITTQRGGNVLSHSGATLWKIEVPEEYVAPRIREKVPEARVERDIHISGGNNSCVKASYYQFALKRFSKANKDKFLQEKSVANSLKDIDGIVQYFTWYQNGEEWDDPSQLSFNLVLELGQVDLYNAIHTLAPPVLPAEIKGVWESMLHIACALRSIHNLEIENTQFNVCHGDIKPENILLVNDCFKLGDSGEALIEVQSAPDRPLTQLGGTKTYASPEKNHPLLVYEGSQELARRDRARKEDVWSLGCVLSVVATWVVLGADGVIQYNKIRQKAHHKRAGIINDSFHDGLQVIQEVTAWHQYLRAAARRTDTISSLVLNLVDNDMLVDAGSRRDTAGIVKGFAEHLDSTGVWSAGFPAEISHLLLEIDEEERHGAASKEPHHNSGDEVEDSEPSAARRTESDSASARELLSQRTKPTVQRLPRNLQQSGPRVDCPVEDLESDSETQAPSEPSNPLPCSPITNIWTLEQQIDSKVYGRGLRSLFRRLRSGRELKPAAKDDELKSFFENRDIIFLVDNAPSMAPHWNQVMHLAKVLLRHVIGYDNDGVEMYFSHGDRKVQVKQRRRQDTTDFINAMEKAAPDSVSGPSRCNIPFALWHIFSESMHASRNKHTTIFVLTDAIWEGYNNDASVERVIKSHMQGMKWDGPGMIDLVQEQRPLSIQFIQFGHDPDATERLRHLDDDLARDGFPDLIDFEPAGGDAHKMLLGSLDDKIDQKLNIVNSTATFSMSSPVSPRSPRSSFGP